jgi:prepilin-type processing-associated H-X9-DG protein
MPTEPNEQRRAWPSRLSIILFFGCVLFLVVQGLSSYSERERDLARRANCLSFEKQILLATAMYADENGGRCPMDSNNPTVVGSMKLLSSWLQSVYMYHCPGDHRSDAREANGYETLTTLNISYSYVPNLKWQDKPDSPLIMDRIYTTKKGDSWPANGNHQGAGGNVGFIDGHVAWWDRLPAALKDKDGKELVLSP